MDRTDRNRVVDLDDLTTMMIDIESGRSPETSSIAPLTPEQREHWDQLAIEIAEIHAAGGSVRYYES